MSKIIFEKLTVEERKNVRGGEDIDPPSPDLCSGPESMPPTKDCTGP